MTNEREEAANKLLMGGGGPPVFKWEEVGQVAKGVIVSMDTRQARKFDKDRPGLGPFLYFGSDGKPTTEQTPDPIMEIVLVVRHDDDGEEYRWVLNRERKAAMLEAVQKAEADGMARGGRAAMQRIDDEPPEAKGLNPKHKFRAQYKPPADVGANDLLKDA